MALFFLLPIFAVAVALLVAGVLFADVAFSRSGNGIAAGSGSKSRMWTPPIVQGDQLQSWAAWTALSVTHRQLAGGRDARTARRVAAAVEAGTTCAVELSPSKRKWDSASRKTVCYRPVAVTPPEAIEIADYLRTHASASRLHEIKLQARKNLDALDGLPALEVADSGVQCPLRCDGKCCVAASSLPIHCRTECPLMGSDAADRVCTSNDIQFDTHARTVGQGVSEGMSAALAAEGLDSTRYELNSALVTALQSDDVAERWANGESVFSQCRRFADVVPR